MPASKRFWTVGSAEFVQTRHGLSGPEEEERLWALCNITCPGWRPNTGLLRENLYDSGSDGQLGLIEIRRPGKSGPVEVGFEGVRNPRSNLKSLIGQDVMNKVAQIQRSVSHKSRKA